MIIQNFGIQVRDSETCAWLVGMGTSGASTTNTGRGLKGLVETKLPWIFWSWWLAHQLELAIKDTLTGTSLDSIDGKLQHLYLIHNHQQKR